MAKNREIGFGDNVRIHETPVTRTAGVSGLVGQVHGWTTPSVTGVEVMGELKEDYAIGIHFKELGKALFFALDLVEFVDHGTGSEVTMGDTMWIREENGKWKECPGGTKHEDLLGRILQKVTGRIFPKWKR